MINSPLVKRIIRITLRIILITVMTIFLILLTVIILIQTPPVQNFARKKIVSFVQSKIHTRFEIGHLRIGFPKKIVLENIYLEDSQKDTLLSAGKIEVDISMFKLLHKKLQLNQVNLDNVTVKIKRILPDSSFNFDYIIKAFSGPPEEPRPKSNSGSFQFDIGKVHWEKIRAVYRDDATGNDGFIYLGKFETQFKKFDPDHLAFSIPDLKITEVRGSLRQYKAPLILQQIPDTSHKENANTPFNLTLGTIAWNDWALDYQNEPSHMKGQLHLGRFLAEAESVDLQKMQMQFKNVDFSNSSASFRIGKSTAARKPSDNQNKNSAASSTNNEWKFGLASLILENDSLQYDDDSKPAVRGVDFNHIRTSQLNIKARNLRAGTDAYSGIIDQFAFNERSGFVLRKFSTEFFYNDRQASLNNLLIQTNQSSVYNHSTITYASPDVLSSKPGEIRTDIQFERSFIAVSDLLKWVPSLSDQMKGNENAMIRIQGKLSGLVKDLNIANLELSGLRHTDVKLSGKLRGLPDANKLAYDLNIAKFNSSMADIESLVPAKFIPSNLRIPNELSVQGTARGDLKQFNTNLSLVTSNGSAHIQGPFNLKEKNYDLQLETNDLDLGYILKQDSLLGKISLRANAKGQGFDFKTMNSVVHIHLLNGEFKNYEYNDLNIDGSIENGKGNLKASIHDEDINFDLDVNADFKAKYPGIQVKLKLDTLNAYALHLLRDTVSFKFFLEANFPSTNPDSLDGSARIYDIVLANKSQRYTPDTVLFLAEAKDTSEHISLHAELADLDWSGKYKLTEVGQALEQTLNHYYRFKGFKEKKISEENWKLKASLRVSPLVLQYYPALRGTDTVEAEMNFRSDTRFLKFSLNTPKIQYGQNIIHNLQVGAITRDSSFNYRIQMADAGQPGFKIYRSTLRGYLANNRFFATINLKDGKDRDRYRLSTLTSPDGNGFRLAFISDSLLLNYDEWNVAHDNYIHYDSGGLIVHDLSIENGTQSLSIKSQPAAANAPIKILFDQFKIRTLTSFAEQDSLLMDGLLNGNLEVKNVLTKPIFTSDLTIKDLSYKKDTIGNVTIKVNNEQANAFAANITIKGARNNVEASGMYFSGESKMNIKLNIAQFDLSLAKIFSAGQLKDIKGDLRGSLVATGNLDAPVLSGHVNFQNAFITPALSGETLILSSDSIQFDNDGFNFDQFVLRDSAGDQATIDGNVYTKDFKKYRFDLSFTARNFRLVNAPKEPNRLFYGKLNIDADIDVSGDNESPKMTSNLRVNRRTDFTVILPSDDPEVQSRQGVVVFVDSKHPIDTVRLRSSLDSLSRVSELKGMDVAAEIETDSAATFTMIIDERNGDALALKGRAYLTGGIDKSGKTSLTGNYELESGSYNVSLSVLKRKFNIDKGSTITWTGDPTKANINISASYPVNAPPIDLVQQQLSGRSQDEMNKYKQKLPFSVVLKMTGELFKPVIKFDITMPPDQLSIWPEVDYKLRQIRTDESEMNKQVFSLLLLNRFVEENPFESAAGGSDVGLMARQSVSKILSDQMNRLAGSLIQGVDLSFDLNSDKDYSTGTGMTQTQLDVNVSKQLFNERIRVTVGSNFQLENTYQNQNTNTFAGNVSVDYRLSKDGRYMLRAYRKDQYETIVEGQVVETGLSFILTFDYNEFKELFRKTKESNPPPAKKHKTAPASPPSEKSQ